MSRFLYLVSMYLGVRAAFNQIRAFFLPRPRSAIIDGETFVVGEFGSVKVRVHARPLSIPFGSGTTAGMISVYSVVPGIPRLVYALLRITSHFGRGHIEIAFLEENEMLTFYAMRNILKANLDRIGGSGLFRNLKLSSDKEEIAVLRAVNQSLNAHGISTSFASPEDCVSFAVNQSLLNPDTRSRTIEALKRRYKSLPKRSAVPVARSN